MLIYENKELLSSPRRTQVKGFAERTCMLCQTKWLQALIWHTPYPEPLMRAAGISCFLDHLEGVVGGFNPMHFLSIRARMCVRSVRGWTKQIRCSYTALALYVGGKQGGSDGTVQRYSSQSDGAKGITRTPTSASFSASSDRSRATTCSDETYITMGILLANLV